MAHERILPEKITKPFQLLAAWLVGLLLITSLLLTAAKNITEPKWLVPFFSISAVVIILVVLVFIFLLQTRFRPQLQEDRFYSEYLKVPLPEKPKRERVPKEKEAEPKIARVKTPKSKTISQKDGSNNY